MTSPINPEADRPKPVNPPSGPSGISKPAWMPGDPVHNETSTWSECTTCGCRWNGDMNVCPECGTELA